MSELFPLPPGQIDRRLAKFSPSLFDQGFYRPLSFYGNNPVKLPAAAQAPPASKTVIATFCEQCGSEAELIPPALFQCKRPSCRRLWAAK